MAGHVRYEKQGTVGHLILDRPEQRNALDSAMWRAVSDTVLEAEQSGVGVLIVRGVDETAFAAGADIGELERNAADPESASACNQAIIAAGDTLAHSPLPTIAMIHGACIGGGVELAVACDFRFAAVGAKFSVTASKIGIVYGAGSTRRLLHLVGLADTKDILFSSRLFEAEEALAMGLVDKVCNAETLAEETSDYAELLAGRSATSISAAKRILDLILAGESDDHPEAHFLRLNSFTGADLKEGITAFRERRSPDFN